MTWVKICGMTSLESACNAVEAGADAVGFVFWDKSPRNISPQKAREIAEQLPSHVEKIGVFVEHSIDDVQRTAEAAALTAVQLHADHYAKRTAEMIALKSSRPDLKLIVALSAKKIRDVFVTSDFKNSLYALMIDSCTKASPGGTGNTFDWSKAHDLVVATATWPPIVIAGGLTPENVGEALKRFKPFGVDVSSGVERAPGKKDPDKVRAFMQAVRAAEKSV